MRLKDSGNPLSWVPATIDDADASRPVERAERRDEGGQSDIGGQPAVDDPGEDAGEDSAGDRRERAPARVLHDDRGDGAREGEHRADGKVDVAVGHDEGEPDGEQSDFREGEQDREAVVEPGPEVRPRPQAEQPERDHQQHRGRVPAMKEGGEPALAEPTRLRGRSARLDRGDRDAADIGNGRRRQAAQPSPQAGEQAAANEPGFDQDGDDEDDAEKRRHGARRQLRHRRHLRRLAAAEIDGAGDRHAFPQNLVDQSDQDGAEAGAEDPAAAAENRRSADDHRRDHDQFHAEAGQRVGVLVLRDAHQTRGHRAERGEHVGAHARRNAC